MRHIIPISGKDSLATAIVQQAYQPDLEYEFIFNDVGNELPETYEWLQEVEEQRDIHIQRIGKSLNDLIEGYGILPAHRVRFCTREGKIEPMEEFIGEEPATVYYGLRADEPKREGYQNGTQAITAKYPLRLHGMGIQVVWRILEDRDLLPPAFFWPRLYNLVMEKTGKTDIAERLEPWVYRQLFSGRSRTNCFHCFYQRLYEWCWLLETHERLFMQALEIEESTGGEEYSWNSHYSLREIMDQQEKFVDKRAQTVAKIVNQAYQEHLFGQPIIELTLMDTTSCGMFCGK